MQLDRPLEVPDYGCKMIDPFQLDPLRARQAQIAKRRSDLNARIAKLRSEEEALASEASEIEITLKTLAKVYGIEPEATAEPKNSKVVGSSTKPEGAPTLFSMVTAILTDYHTLLDQNLVESDIIYDEIRQRWWPDAPRNSIIPSLWRFAKEDRLVKEGTAYGLVLPDETPGAGTPDASEPEWDVDDEIPF